MNAGAVAATVVIMQQQQAAARRRRLFDEGAGIVSKVLEENPAFLKGINRAAEDAARLIGPMADKLDNAKIEPTASQGWLSRLFGYQSIGTPQHAATGQFLALNNLTDDFAKAASVAPDSLQAQRYLRIARSFYPSHYPEEAQEFADNLSDDTIEEYGYKAYKEALLSGYESIGAGHAGLKAGFEDAIEKADISWQDKQYAESSYRQYCSVISRTLNAEMQP